MNNLYLPKILDLSHDDKILKKGGFQLLNCFLINKINSFLNLSDITVIFWRFKTESSQSIKDLLSSPLKEEFMIFRLEPLLNEINGSIEISDANFLNLKSAFFFFFWKKNTKIDIMIFVVTSKYNELFAIKRNLILYFSKIIIDSKISELFSIRKETLLFISMSELFPLLKYNP